MKKVKKKHLIISLVILLFLFAVITVSYIFFRPYEELDVRYPGVREINLEDYPTLDLGEDIEN